MRARRSFGFTLLELLIVVAIIGVLATLILGGLQSARRRAQIAVCRNNIASLKAALQMYETDMGLYPFSPGHPTQSGANLMSNDIAYVWAALRNRRTAQFGGGPNSPYLDWKPEQVGKITLATVSAVPGSSTLGITSDGGNPSQPLIDAGGSLLDPTVDFDPVMNNQLSYFQNIWPASGTTALVFCDPWGNPFCYWEWASVPQAAKDTLITTPVTIGSSTGGGTAYPCFPHDPSKFDIYSYGPNGVNEAGYDDDVTSWTSAQQQTPGSSSP
jgi:prepilin-type N-terminal cleavage/methylation domain-containing protein